MIRYLLTFIAIGLSISVFAQQSPDHSRNPISVNLYRVLEQADPHAELHLVVKGDMTQVTLLAGEYEAMVKYAYSNLGSIRIPAGRVQDLAQLPAVQYLDISTAKGQLLNDAMRKNSNVDSVHAGLGGLPDSIQGEGVILAFLDTGLELGHPDFWNSDSSTRVKYVWDQSVGVGPNTPAKYGYGQVWDSTDIDDGNSTHKDNHGHGSRVAGIASGNGQTVEHYKGVAPKSDIIIVEVDLGQDFLNNVTDAVDFVFSKADELGKPAVVNASLGTYFGSHDGLDLHAQLIDNMIQQKPGRAMVCAVGNAGTGRFHLGYPITSDTAFTWYRKINNQAFAYVQVWADTADFNRAWFSVGINRNGSFGLIGRTPFRNTVQDFNLSVGVNKVTDTLKNSNGQRVGWVDIYAEQRDNRYMFDLVTYLDSTNYLVQLAATGEGRFDCWSEQGATGTSNFVTGNLPDTTAYPPIKHYRQPDGEQTMVSSWACSPNVITVGNFVNRNKYANWNNDTTRVNLTVGALEVSSSSGPARTGLIKPDITASGQIILSPAPFSLLNSWKNSLPNNISREGWHARFGASSAASPIVAGVAALYFQLRPDADHEELIEALHISAKQDTFTGPNLPNNIWGYGKVDALSMLTTIKGCMDTAALNYDPLAVISDTCTYPPIGINLLNNKSAFHLYPNPAHNQFVIALPQTPNRSMEVQLINTTGQVVRAHEATDTTILTLDRGTLPNGLYVVSLWMDGQYVGARSIIFN